MARFSELLHACQPDGPQVVSRRGTETAVLAFRCWARLMHRQSDTLVEDAMIAAIAKVHQLTVVTRNVSDFRRFDVPLLHPCVVSRS